MNSETMTEAEQRAAQAVAEAYGRPAVVEEPAKLKPNRRDIRAAGGRVGLYRMPRRAGGVAGGHWLGEVRNDTLTKAARTMQETDDCVEYHAARRVVVRRQGHRIARAAGSAAWRAACAREAGLA